MTPAKVLMLLRKREDDLSVREIPLACFQAMYYNMNRNPGDPDKGIAPAPVKAPAEFKVFGRRGKTLAAKEDGPGGKHNLYGARADRGNWESWASGRGAREVKVVRTRKE